MSFQMMAFYCKVFTSITGDVHQRRYEAVEFDEFEHLVYFVVHQNHT